MKTILSVIALLVVCFFSYSFLNKSDAFAGYQFATDTNKTGFIAVDCWFSPSGNSTKVECYQMQVPENHLKPDGRFVTFPVAVFRSATKSENKAPMLHLGGGGPGGPMYLEYSHVIENIWGYYDDMSTNIGRDLFVIDPRGTGLARPLLSCQRFVDNEKLRLGYNLSMQEEIAEIDADYRYCIDQYLADGVDFSTYNSRSIAEDIEVMRQAAGLQSWVLYGVSYGSVYAQTIAKYYPESVESMVLDSAAFTHIKLHDNYLEKTMSPYLKLFNYCEFDPACTEQDSKMEQRIWALYDHLSETPIQIVMDHPYEKTTIPVVVNGERFLAALFQGIYGVDIFRELPQIVSDLESRKTESLVPYLNRHVEYMLDRGYGDVSAAAHYCSEDKPYIDFDRIDLLIEKLPEKYIQDAARIGMEAQDFCDQMQIISSEDKLAKVFSTDIPTLFLQGRFDTVTPLADVEASRVNYSNHELASFDLSHSIITSSPCAEIIAGRFIQQHFLADSDFDCGE